MLVNLQTNIMLSLPTNNLQANHHIDDIYSVTQSYANSFWGDVVLDNFNNVSRDEDNMLGQIYIDQICLNFNYHDYWCL